MTEAQILKIGEMKIVNKHLLNLSKFNDEGHRLYAIKTLGITLVGILVLIGCPLAAFLILNCSFSQSNEKRCLLNNEKKSIDFCNLFFYYFYTTVIAF